MIHCEKGHVNFKGEEDTLLAEMACVVNSSIDMLVDGDSSRDEAIDTVDHVVNMVIDDAKKEHKLVKVKVNKLDLKEAMKELLKLMEDENDGRD